MFGSTLGFSGSADRMALTLGKRAMQRRSQGEANTGMREKQCARSN